MKLARPDPRKLAKPTPGPYRRIHPANSAELHHRRMCRALAEPDTPRWMLYASGYDRLVLRWRWHRARVQHAQGDDRAPRPTRLLSKARWSHPAGLRRDRRLA